MSKAGQITGCQCRAAHTMELTIGNDNAHDDDLEAKPKQIRSSKKKKNNICPFEQNASRK